MEGDKLIFLEEHYIKADTILPHIKDKKIVAIGGVSGTGKSEVAYLLRSKLAKKGIRSIVMHLDDYYTTNFKERNEVRKESGIIGIGEMCWVRINDPLTSFLKGEHQIYIRVLNKFTEGKEYRIVWVADIDMIIVEGLYANNIIHADYKVHLKGDRQSTHAFRRKRGKEPITEFRVKVLEAESEAVSTLVSKADLEV